MFGGENNKKVFIIIVVAIIIWLAIQFYNLYRTDRFDKALEATHNATEATLLMDDLKVVVTKEALMIYNLSTYDVQILKRKDIRGGLSPYGRLIFATEQNDIEMALFELSNTEASVRTQFLDKRIVGKLKGVYFLIDDELLHLIPLH